MKARFSSFSAVWSDGRRRQLALIYDGCWAVHVPQSAGHVKGWRARRWTISHAPTGIAVHEFQNLQRSQMAEALEILAALRIHGRPVSELSGCEFLAPNTQAQFLSENAGLIAQMKEIWYENHARLLMLYGGVLPCERHAFDAGALRERLHCGHMEQATLF